MKAFVHATVHLNRFNADICREIMGIEEVSQAINYLYWRNPFLAPPTIIFSVLLKDPVLAEHEGQILAFFISRIALYKSAIPLCIGRRRQGNNISRS
jgi:hypothetical protein